MINPHQQELSPEKEYKEIFYQLFREQQFQPN